MRRFRRSGFRRGAKAPTHWHRERNLATLTTGTNVETILLDVTDYNANTALSPSGVTVVRTLVDIAWVPGPGSAGGQAIIDWALWVLDQDEVNLNPTTSQNLIDERVLDHGGVGILVGGTTLDTLIYSQARFFIDCKQKVRLKDSKVALAIRAVHGFATLQAIVHSSVLLRGDTT